MKKNVCKSSNNTSSRSCNSFNWNSEFQTIYQIKEKEKEKQYTK